MNEVVNPQNAQIASAVSTLVTPILQVLGTLLTAVLIGLATKAWNYFKSAVHVNDVSLLSAGVARIAGEIVNKLDAVTENPDTNSVTFDVNQFISNAVGDGVQTLMQQRFPEITAKLGVTPTTVAGMIQGELGKLIASGAAARALPRM